MSILKSIAGAMHEADAVRSPHLDGVRRIASAGFLIYLWFMTVVVSVLAYGWSNQWEALTVISFVLAAIATRAWNATPIALKTRLTIGVCMTGNWMMLLFASTGYGNGEFILDAHMIFFVINGLFLAYFCWRTIFVSTCMTFVHHLGLHFFAPLLIWPTDSYAQIHLVNHLLLAAFTGPGGMVVSVAICRLFGKAKTAMQQQVAEKEEANRLLAEVRRQRTDGEYVVETLADALKRLSDGDLGVSIDGKFPGVYEKLRADFNLSAERLETAKSNFVSTVSHELRTPLTSIRGAIGMIQGASPDQRSDVEIRLLGIAHSNCERLMKLVNDLLDIDRLAKGTFKAKFARHEIGELCRSVTKDLEPYAQGLGIVVTHVANNEKLFTQTDPSLFSQVLSNLLSNAVKFSEPGSTVTVIAESEGEGEDGRIRISVLDSGPGISDAFAPYVFERFRQGDGSDTRAYSGSGVGLHICKSIMDQLGGDIGFDNNPNGGTTFWFDVPYIGGRQSTRSHVDRPQVEQTSLPRILHVEDDTAFAEVLQLACQGRAEFVCAGSYREATKFLDDHEVDLLLLDWELPDGSGIDILSHAKISGSIVPVVSLSSSSETWDSSRTALDIVKSEMSIAQVAEIIFSVIDDHARSKERLSEFRRIA